MDCPKKSNKISDIVRLQQILKKWKKLANAPKNNSNSSTSSSSNTNLSRNKSMKFIKRTLSFQDVSSHNNDFVPKGYLAVCVGKELKRYTIPTEYLSHHAFGILLREAEEEFGFQQEGVLKIPCEVSLFEKILKVVEDKRRLSDVYHSHDLGLSVENDINVGCYSPDNCELTDTHHPLICR